VAVPADTASASEVVKAYLEALDAHDCDTAKAVATGGFAATADRWCTGVAGLTHVEVKTPNPEDPRWLGFPRHTPAEFVSVPVAFELDWRWFHGDGSLEEGRTGWGYILVRDEPDGQWRIFDQGCC